MYDKERSEYIRAGFNIRRDCFAFDQERRMCKALKELYCACEECKFYKKKNG